MEKLKQFKQSSSWREDMVTIKAGANAELDFIDTTPNMFICQNTTNEKINISIGSIPTLNNYEFTVEKNSVATFGRPVPTRKIYLYNTGSSVATVKIFSVHDTFDMNVLKNISMKLEGEGLSIQTDGIVRGFQAGVSLPAGNNKIGIVELDESDVALIQTIGENIDNIDTNMSAVMVNVASNLSNTNKIVEDIAEIVTVLSGSGEGGTGIDTRMYYINGDCYDKIPVYQNKVNSISYTSTDECTFYLSYLLNDGTDVDITINDTVVLSVLSGEQLTDISFNLNTGDTITVTGTGANIRAKYYVF